MCDVCVCVCLYACLCVRACACVCVFEAQRVQTRPGLLAPATRHSIHTKRRSTHWWNGTLASAGFGAVNWWIFLNAKKSIHTKRRSTHWWSCTGVRWFWCNVPVNIYQCKERNPSTPNAGARTGTLLVELIHWFWWILLNAKKKSILTKRLGTHSAGSTKIQCRFWCNQLVNISQCKKEIHPYKMPEYALNWTQ